MYQTPSTPDQQVLPPPCSALWRDTSTLPDEDHCHAEKLHASLDVTYMTSQNGLIIAKKLR